MPEIEVRPAAAADIALIKALDHHYSSDYVWQMDVVAEESEVKVQFREVHLPRSVRVEYPRSPASLETDWDKRSALLVARLDDQIAGYISMELEAAPYTAWTTDLVVMRRLRRQGIGSTLVIAGQEWARQQRVYRMVLEMQPKNYPAIRLAQKLGFDFCGYNDRFYPNHDIALFFAKSVR